MEDSYTITCITTKENLLTEHLTHFNELAKEQPWAWVMLQASAFFASDISWEILKHWPKHKIPGLPPSPLIVPVINKETKNNGNDLSKFPTAFATAVLNQQQNAREILVKYGLWQWDEAEQMVHMQPLLQEVVRELLQTSFQSELHERINEVTTVLHYRGNNLLASSSAEKEQQYRQLLIHQQILLTHTDILIEQADPSIIKTLRKDKATFLLKMMVLIYLNIFKKPSLAKPLAEQAVTILTDFSTGPSIKSDYDSTNSDLAIALENLGKVYMDLNLHSDAQTQLQKALKIQTQIYDDKFYIVQNIRSLLATNAQQMIHQATAQKDVKKATQLCEDYCTMFQDITPFPFWIYHNLACNYIALGQIEKAEKTFRYLLDKNYTMATSADFGHFLYQQGQLSKAISQLEMTLRLLDDDTELLYEAMERDNIEPALRHLVDHQILAKPSPQTLAYYLLIKATHSSDPAASLEWLKAFQEEVKSTGLPIDYYLLGCLHAFRNEPEQARQSWIHCEFSPLPFVEEAAQWQPPTKRARTSEEPSSVAQITLGGIIQSANASTMPQQELPPNASMLINQPL